MTDFSVFLKLVNKLFTVCKNIILNKINVPCFINIIDVYKTLTRLTEVHRKFITNLRVNNIKFPIETGRWRNIDREDRICQKCSLS